MSDKRGKVKLVRQKIAPRIADVELLFVEKLPFKAVNEWMSLIWSRSSFTDVLYADVKYLRYFLGALALLQQFMICIFLTNEQTFYLL